MRWVIAVDFNLLLCYDGINMSVLRGIMMTKIWRE